MWTSAVKTAIRPSRIASKENGGPQPAALFLLTYLPTHLITISSKVHSQRVP